MAIFNRTFFDLNGERGYCVDGLPPDVVSDLKISVPNRTESIRMASLFSRGETVRIVFVAVWDSTIRPVALFRSDQRTMLRVGVPYPLSSQAEGYGGLIVFDENIRADANITDPLPVSEECLTRFEPSAIPYVSMTCDSVRLTGEVRLSSGDSEKLVSDGIDVPEELFSCTRALRLGLIDTLSSASDNPMIALANGVNSYFGDEDRRSPIYKLFGAMPDSSGTLLLRFGEHFYFAPVGEPAADISVLAIGSDRTTEEVCQAINGVEEETSEEPEIVCPPSGIEFEIIEYE